MRQRGCDGQRASPFFFGLRPTLPEPPVVALPTALCAVVCHNREVLATAGECSGSVVVRLRQETQLERREVPRLPAPVSPQHVRGSCVVVRVIETLPFPVWEVASVDLEVSN